MSRTTETRANSDKTTSKETRDKVATQVASKLVPDQPLYVSDDGKNGLVTAIGIVLAFTLSFVGEWSLTPESWQPNDRLPAILLLSGITVQTIALLCALVPYKQTVRRYYGVVCGFVAGIVLIAVGIVVAVTIV